MRSRPHPDQVHQLFCRVLLRHADRLGGSNCLEPEKLDSRAVLLSFAFHLDCPDGFKFRPVSEKVAQVRHRRQDLFAAGEPRGLFLLLSQFDVAVVEDGAEALPHPLAGESFAFLRAEAGHVKAKQVGRTSSMTGFRLRCCFGGRRLPGKLVMLA